MISRCFKLVTDEFLLDAGVPAGVWRLSFIAWDHTAYIDVRCKRRYKRKLIRQRRRVRREGL